MTVLREKKEPLSDLTYTEAYDLGGRDFEEDKPRRVRAPRYANASFGRFGYTDGYDDARDRAAIT